MTKIGKRGTHPRVSLRRSNHQVRVSRLWRSSASAVKTDLANVLRCAASVRGLSDRHSARSAQKIDGSTVRVPRRYLLVLTSQERVPSPFADPAAYPFAPR